MDANWWYMGAAFIFIISIPLLAKNEKYIPLILVWVIVLPRFLSGKNGVEIAPGTCSPYEFMVPFLLGVLCTQHHFLENLMNKPHKWIRFVIEVVILVLSYKAFRNIDVSPYWELRFGLIAFVAIIFLAEYVINIPVFDKVFLFFGKHSMNIFLVHGLIRAYLIRELYSLKYFALIAAALLLISLAASILIDAIKKVVRYNQMVEAVCRKIRAHA